MAQATGRTTPKAGGKASSHPTAKITTTKAATNGASSASGASAARASSTSSGTATAASGGGWRGWMDRSGVTKLLQPVGSVLAPGTGKGQTAGGTSGAAGTKRPRSSSWKFLIGMMIFVFSAEFLVYLLSFVDRAVFHGALESTTIGTVPLLGKLSPFFLLYIVLTLGLWLALYRFNIIPRDPFGVKAQQATARGRNGTTSSASNAGRNRTARRGTSTTSAAAKDTSSSQRAVSGPNDAVYQRVKAAQRARKRRDAKR